MQVLQRKLLVERKLENENLNKNSLGREKFIEKVWEWKNDTRICNMRNHSATLPCILSIKKTY